MTIELTINGVQASKTRARAYDAHVEQVTYYTRNGSKLATFTAPEEVVLSDADATAKLSEARIKLLTAAGIPPLGTSWQDAKAQLPALWPIITSDGYNYGPNGRRTAYIWKDGAVLNDFAPEDGKKFQVFLQQVEGDWMPKSATSISVNDLLYRNASNSLDVSVTGPGLACYTPDTNDRCAVLEFSPTGDDFVLSAAYGVIEMPNAATTEAGFKGFFGDTAAVFGTFSSKVFYDRDEMRTDLRTTEAGVNAGGGQEVYVAGAGEDTEREPYYDPLKTTSGINPIKREMAVYAIGGAVNRMPLVYVLQN